MSAAAKTVKKATGADITNIDFLQRLAAFENTPVSAKVLTELQAEKEEAVNQLHKNALIGLAALVKKEVDELRELRKKETRLLASIKDFENVGKKVIAGDFDEETLTELSDTLTNV